MKTEIEIRDKLKELEDSLKSLEIIPMFFLSKRNQHNIEFLKNNIAFIKWALEDDICKCKCECSRCNK